MTLAHVAQRANVSVSTVSRYLRGQLKVNPDTAARIDEAVRELKYEVTTPACDRNPPQNPVIAMAVPELINPFFAELTEAAAAAAAASNVSLLVGVSGLQARREATLSDFVADSDVIDGLIYVGMHRENEALARAIGNGLPVVVLDEEISGTSTADTISVDNYGGAYQATAYLAQLGHRRIAHVAGPAELSTTRDRARGYRDAMADAGLDVHEDLVLHGPYTEQFGASTFPHLVHSGKAPSAVFVGSDIVAVGMLSAAELHGIRIPDDLSIVGCDGIGVGEWLRPRLTTLQQPVADLARSAIDIVQTRIESPEHERIVRKFPLQLVVRGSAARPR
ncbi:LacI family DNA-binding transcriptional regulator [Amycolatopsis sp. cmx-11-12]|uniref:LacI family DNA-binding transcriptional regulator n=1 Tax=Amycolatopsis sp. cmx-11-12 TaxID=2785795 RepID=UPI003917D55E